MPGRPGKYRVSLEVRDGKAEPRGHLPLHVKGTPDSKPIADAVDLPFVVVGDGRRCLRTLGWMGDFAR